MIPQALVFMFTYKCNFVCKHCSVSAGPNRTERVNLSLIKKAIDQAYNIPSIRLIVFTGGETTLHLPNLIEAIRYSTDKGFMTRIVTNAWWAKTPEKANEILIDLAKAGLKELNISYDDFHAPYLEKYGGEKNVVNAIRAAKEMGLSSLIGVVIHPKSKINTNYLRNLFEREKIDNIQFLEDVLFPLGRARMDLSEEYFVLDPDAMVYGPCREAGQTIVVLPNGDLSFCCGHIMGTEAEDMIIVGNVNNGETLPEIIDRMQKNVFYWWLHLKGPYTVAKEIGINRKFYRNCEICYYLATEYEQQVLSLAKRKDEIFSTFETGQCSSSL